MEYVMIFAVMRFNDKWEIWSKLRSSDYNFYYDKGYTVQHIPKQDFDSSLAYSNRVLLVGAPYAGYGNHTNHSNVGSGK